MLRTPEEDLFEFARKAGLPSLKEVLSNKYGERDRMLGREDEMITSIDAGDKQTGARQKYYLSDGTEYRIESIEQAERIARDMGLNLHQDFIYDGQYQDDDGIYLKVTFRTKRSVHKRSQW